MADLYNQQKKECVIWFCDLSNARRIYLAYENDGKAHYLVGEKRREVEEGRILNSSEENIAVKRAIVGVHLGDDNDDYYMLKR